MKYLGRVLLGLAIVVIIFGAFFVLNAVYDFIPEKIDFNDDQYQRYVRIKPKSKEAYGFVYVGIDGDVRGYVQVKMSPEEFSNLGYSGVPVSGKANFGLGKPLWWSPPRDCPVYNRGTEKSPTYYCYDGKANWLFIALP